MKNELLQQLEHELIALPEIQIGKDMWQNTLHEYDVYEHTIQYVHEMRKIDDRPMMIAAGYLHDIGKPVTAKLKYKDGKLQEKSPGKPYHTFDEHERIGEEMVLAMTPDLFERYHLDQTKIAALVGYHYTPLKGIKRMREQKTVDAFRTAFDQLDYQLQHLKETVTKKECLDMFLADKLGQGKNVSDIKELILVREALIDEPHRATLLEEVYELQKAYDKR